MSTEFFCPKCRNSTDARLPSCSSCGADLLAVFEGRALGSVPAAKPRRKRAKASPLFLLAAALLCGAAGVVFLRGLWIIAGPDSGKRLPDRAYIDRSHRFAFTPPSGWQFDVLDEDAGGGLRRAARLSRGATTLEVCVGPARFMEEDDASLLRRAFNGVQAQAESVETGTLDGLVARRLRASGGRVYLPSSSAGKRASAQHAAAPQFESLELAALVVVAKNGDQVFMAKAYGDKTALEEDASDVERWLSSFRVLDRPWK